MKYAFCTSFSPQGYEVYGKRFLEGFLKHSRFPIFVYYEGVKPDLEGPVYRDLFEQQDLLDFLKTCPPDGRDYRYQANRFSRKVFAVTHQPEAEWWVWLDADVDVHGAIDERFMERVCPEGFDGSYIGRVDWHHSECGFVGYRDRSTLQRLRDVYQTGEVFALGEWHDSYVFDQVRQGEWFNLADGCKGMHPWPDTPLGEVMTHHKGPKAKKERYALQTA